MNYFSFFRGKKLPSFNSQYFDKKNIRYSHDFKNICHFFWKVLWFWIIFFFSFFLSWSQENFLLIFFLFGFTLLSLWLLGKFLFVFVNNIISLPLLFSNIYPHRISARDSVQDSSTSVLDFEGLLLMFSSSNSTGWKYFSPILLPKMSSSCVGSPASNLKGVVKTWCIFAWEVLHNRWWL